MAQALIDAGMERARIGVSGIRRGFYTHGRAFHGVVNHSSYAEVLRRLPNAKFENATEVIGYARYVKSDEQIACLRRGAAIAAAGIDKMIELARPGVDEGYSLHAGHAPDGFARQRVLSDGVLQRSPMAAAACRALKIRWRDARFSRCTDRQRSRRGVRRADRPGAAADSCWARSPRRGSRPSSCSEKCTTPVWSI